LTRVNSPRVPVCDVVAMSAQPITSYYEQDHRRLDEHFREFQRLKRTNFHEARLHFRKFKVGLERHIVWEEALLFPPFEEKTGMRQGPTTVMRMEHQQIKSLLEQVREKLRAGNPDTDAEESALLQVLGAHNHKEEMILYPAIDQVLSEPERKEVFAAMERTPEPAQPPCECVAV
jgi:regulator of cell morphogenesis and NO signaling